MFSLVQISHKVYTTDLLWIIFDEAVLIGYSVLFVFDWQSGVDGLRFIMQHVFVATGERLDSMRFINNRIKDPERFTQRESFNSVDKINKLYSEILSKNLCPLFE